MQAVQEKKEALAKIRPPTVGTNKNLEIVFNPRVKVDKLPIAPKEKREALTKPLSGKTLFDHNFNSNTSNGYYWGKA